MSNNIINAMIRAATTGHDESEVRAALVIFAAAGVIDLQPANLKKAIKGWATLSVEILQNPDRVESWKRDLHCVFDPKDPSLPFFGPLFQDDAAAALVDGVPRANGQEAIDGFAKAIADILRDPEKVAFLKARLERVWEPRRSARGTA